MTLKIELELPLSLWQFQHHRQNQREVVAKEVKEVRAAKAARVKPADPDVWPDTKRNMR